MDSVKGFKFQFDLTAIDTFYDMFHGEMHHRPPTGWDIDDLSQKVNMYDTSPKIPVEMVQKCQMFMAGHTEQNGLEKKVRNLSKAIVMDAFTENAFPDLPAWLLPVMRPGKTFRGNVSLEITAPMNLVDVNLKFMGLAYTKIITRGRQRTIHIDKEVYIDTQQILWPEIREEITQEVTSSCFGCCTGGPEKKTLQPGKYRFPFQFMIPPGAKPTFPMVPLAGGNVAKISYYLKASLNRGNCCNRGNIITYSALWVDLHVDIGSYLVPVNKEDTQTTGAFGKGGTITTIAHLPRKGFVRGEIIPLSLEVNNGSSEPITGVEARLCLQLNYKTRGILVTRERDCKILGTPATSGPISPGMCPQLSLNIPFELPFIDWHFCPGGTLEDCEIINISYQVQVILRRPGLSFKKHVTLPVFIGNCNSQGIQAIDPFTGVIQATREW